MGRGVYVLQGMLYDATGDRVTEVADLTRAKALPGRHNWQNAAAAYAAALALGVAPEEARLGLMSFPGLAHRMERSAASAACASSTTARPPTPTPRARP
jgi:UDP-N-acetylmuramoylalanine--D-glutamate ligase